MEFRKGRPVRRPFLGVLGVGQREQVKKPTSDLGDLLTRAQDKILHFLLQSFGIYAIVKMLSV